jgi:hypothetical protein
MATLTAEDDHGGRQVMLDCPHGTTGAIVAGGTVPDTALVRAVIVTHDAVEGCACTRDLRRRYGVGLPRRGGRR